MSEATKYSLSPRPTTIGGPLNRDDLVRIVGRDQHEREETPQVQQRPPHRILETIVLHLALDQVGDDLGVGLGDEAVTFLLELPFQIEVVLDDPVVHDDDLSRAIAVGVRVLLGRPAVGRPARVADPVLTVQRIDGEDFFESRQLSGAAAQLDRAVAHDRDAGRVVTAILQPPQPFDQDGQDFLVADVADDSAHVSIASR